MTARNKTTTMTMKIVPMTNLSLDPAAAEEKHDEDNDHEDEEEATRTTARIRVKNSRMYRPGGLQDLPPFSGCGHDSGRSPSSTSPRQHEQKGVYETPRALPDVTPCKSSERSVRLGLYLPVV